MRRLLMRIPPPLAAILILLATFLIATAATIFAGVSQEVAVSVFGGLAIPGALIAACGVSFHRFSVAWDVADAVAKLPSAEQLAAIISIRAVDAELGEAVAYALNDACKRRAAAEARDAAIRNMPAGVADALRRRGVLEGRPAGARTDPIAALDQGIERRKKKEAG